ncbi:MAG: efflux RND transporter periplasmic adaptor subunit [Isosphaeraceae bacterium]|nr:efflux RND transporter periplasmic adaptor subunit [Isosphaeraceae bacterium]
MRSKNRCRRLGLAAASAIVLAALGCEEPIAAKDDPARTKPAAPTKAEVEVVHPLRQAVRRTVEQPGRVEAAELTPIHAKLAGYARNVAVDIGDRVQKGQVLAELDVPEIEADAAEKRAEVDQAESRHAQALAAVKVAQAGVEQAEAKWVEVQASIKKAEADLARYRSEFERAQQLTRDRAVTEAVLDEARNRFYAAEAARDAARAGAASAQAARSEAKALLEKARSDVKAAESGIEVARATARHAEALLGYARIEAPYDGTVIRRFVDTGHLTVPGPQGTPLFIVSRSDLVTVVVGVPEAQAGSVHVGDRALSRFQALDGKPVEGKVSRTSFALDDASRTLRTEIDLPNPEGVLRPGLYANVSIITEEHPDALTIPATALIRDGAKAFCVCIIDGKAHRRPVEVGITDGAVVEILSGLKGDELVVKANPAALTEGQPVEPVESKESPPAGAKP